MSLDIMKARAVIALIIGAGVWGLVAFLQERAIFEPTVFVVLAGASFWMQTGGLGLPVRLPSRFDEPLAELRKSLGETAWTWVRAGSGIWTLVQALAFGLISLSVQALIIGLLGNTGMSAEWASGIGTVLAVATASFSLGLLTRWLSVRTGVAGRFDGFKASLKRASGIDLDIDPNAALAAGSLVRAVAVQVGKSLVVAWSAFFFSWWFAAFLGGGILLAVIAPEFIKQHITRLRAKEATDVRAE